MNVCLHESAEFSVPPPRPATLCLRLFGPFHALVHGRSLPKTRTRKEVWLLALLVLHADAPLERSWLAGVLWPDAPEEAALYNLRRSLHGLRQALGPEADRLLSPTPRTLRLDLNGADCDVAAFDSAVRRGDAAALAEAAALYSGPLLLGCLEEWALPEREAREQAALGALERLATSAREHGDLAEATARLGRVLEIDPLRETSLRGLMETLAAQGRHAAASEAFRTFRLRLRDELNADPDAETVALYRRLQTEARQPVPQKLPDPAPALAPAAEAPHLPIPLTALIGREREAGAVAAALDDARLVTLTGTGGVGKTRLALAVAQTLAPEFPDGAWFADLSPLADPKLMVQAVLAALGVGEAPGRSPSEALTDFLRPKRLLLVLDNCEHLVTACGHLSRALLEQCPGLRLLATSREPLGVAGEVQWRVPSLSLPDASPPDDAAGAAESEAVRLFVARTRQARPGWTPSGPEYAAVADIVRRLDGIPLAIEMAAARMRSLPVAQIAARLGDAFRLLSGPGGGQVPRQQTLRATLDWSWDLLSDAEKTMLSRLSVFAGGWTLEAAEGVCAEPPAIVPECVLDVLTSLVDKSLVVYEEQPDGTGRYLLLETVRQYARERLAEETGTLRGRHAEWFLALAEQAESELTGPEQPAWLERLETEHDNLRASLSWYEQRPDGGLPGLRLAGALGRFWDVRGHLSEGRQWLDRILQKNKGPAVSSGLEAAASRARALNGAGTLAYRQSDFAAAQALYEESLTLRRLLDDRQSVANTLLNLGNVALSQSEYNAAQALYEESLALLRLLDDRRSVANALNNLGNVALRQGDYAGARDLFEESLTIARQFEDQQGIANALINLGLVAYNQGSYAAAREKLEESLIVNRRLGSQYGIAHSLVDLGNIALSQGDIGAAQALHGESLALRRRLGDRQGISNSLVNLGTVAFAQGDFGAAQALYAESLTVNPGRGEKYGVAYGLEGLAGVAGGQGLPSRAARLWGAASSLRRSIGSPLTPEDQAETDKQITSVRESLGEEAFGAAWAEGETLGWEQASEYALSGMD